MTEPHVIIAGGGIGGLATALTLHQIGVPFTVFESVRELAPLGVGVNLQPNAVRELYDLGIGAEALDTVGLPAREWALVGLNGNDIYAEPRGALAGYNWPQYAVHRGRFHMLLHETLVKRAGPDAVRLGHKVTGYEQRSRRHGHRRRPDVPTARRSARPARCSLRPTASIRRSVRRCTPASRRSTGAARSCGAARRMARPIRSGASFVGLGTHRSASSSTHFASRSPRRASRPSTGSPRSPRECRSAGHRAAGSDPWRSASSRITSMAGCGTGSTCRTSCAAPTSPTRIR